MKTTLNERVRLVRNLESIGIQWDDIQPLRRIAMTLRRWFELECGDGNNYSSWCITRGRKEKRYGQHQNGHGAHSVFIHDENGKPFMESHSHSSTTVLYQSIPDRENGARKRLAKIMARYPELTYYIQTDPRGASLYILRKSDVIGSEIEQVYTRGVDVY